MNVLGPLVNPLQPKRQVIGVYRHDLIAIVLEALQEMGCAHACVVHSQEGLDELSVSAPTRLAYLRQGQVTFSTVSPQDVGLLLSSLAAVQGRAPQENAHTIRAILLGKLDGPKLELCYSCRDQLIL